MKTLVLLILCVFVFGYEQSQMHIKAKVFEKILLLDTNLQNKLTAQKSVDIIIFYDENEELDATRLKRYLIDIAKDDNFPYLIDIKLVTYKKFKEDIATAYFLLDSRNIDIVNSIASLAIEKGIISFSYNYKYLEYNVMLSIKMDQKVYPIINPEAILESKINFKPILIRISKRYTK